MSQGIWDFETAVIGGGPGGLMSALYLKRYRRSVALFQQGKPRADWIPKTNNILGFPQGVSGRELLARLNRHLLRLGLERFNGEARVTRYRQGFRIRMRDLEFKARTVILATGFRDIEPAGAEVTSAIVNDLRTRGLLRYCPICDAFDHRDQELAVLTRDDSGVERALFLSRFTPILKIIVPPELRLGARRIQQIHEARARVFRGHLVSLDRSRFPRGLWIHLDSGKEIFCRYCYIELGCLITESAFSELNGLRRSKDGFLITTTEQRTSIPGLYAAGDCVNLLGQISVAAGQAAVAATTIHNDLPER